MNKFILHQLWRLSGYLQRRGSALEAWVYTKHPPYEGPSLSELAQNAVKFHKERAADNVMTNNALLRRMKKGA